ncbi:MAG: glycosyltransferase, partial [Tepidisphaeraceae bacterium]
EALCCGVPALVSVGAGIAERYPGDLRRQTLLDDPNDAAGLASKLRAWRKDVETYRASVDPISRTLRAHTWRAMAEQMLQVIEAVD